MMSQWFHMGAATDSNLRNLILEVLMFYWRSCLIWVEQPPYHVALPSGVLPRLTWEGKRECSKRQPWKWYPLLLPISHWPEASHKTVELQESIEKICEHEQFLQLQFANTDFVKQYFLVWKLESLLLLGEEYTPDLGKMLW